MPSDPGPAPRIEGFDGFVPLGTGGTATVWSARQLALGREVAIKTLDPALVSGDEAIDAFQSEARSAARLSHPGVVRVFDAFYRDGRFCIVMEKLDGETLAARIAGSGPLSEAEALATAACVSSAMRHAWDREKLVHRDLKPDNVMLVSDGTAKVMDFGLASSAFTLQARRAAVPGAAPEWVWGTPAYMSPEQAVGTSAPAPQSDMYSLGATLFHAVAGRRLFDGAEGGDSAVMAAQVSSVYPSARDFAPGLSLPFCDFLERLLAKRPEDRFAGWDEVEAAISALSAGTARRRDILPPRRDSASSPFSTVAHAHSSEASAAVSRAASAVRAAAGRASAAAEAVRRDASSVSPLPGAAASLALAAALAVLAGAEAFSRVRRSAASRRAAAAVAALDSLQVRASAGPASFDAAVGWCDAMLAAPDASRDSELFALVWDKRETLRAAAAEEARRDAAGLAATWARVAASGPAGAEAAASGIRAYAGPFAAATAPFREEAARKFAAGGAAAPGRSGGRRR